MISAGVFYDEQVSKSRGVTADHVYVNELAYTKKSCFCDMITLFIMSIYSKKHSSCRDIRKKVKYIRVRSAFFMIIYPICASNPASPVGDVCCCGYTSRVMAGRVVSLPAGVRLTMM
jgi:hypothetical protein